MKKLEEYVRSIPDFPEPGIIFRDITTILQDADGLKLAIDTMQDCLKDVDVDVIVGTESRGFIFGVPIAYNLHKPFVPVRKKGKLPCETVSKSYDLEYGSATIEMHKDSIKPGQKVALVDDLIATGGTIEAAIQLIEELGGEVVKVVFLMELAGLKGRERLKGDDVASVVCYGGKWPGSKLDYNVRAGDVDDGDYKEQPAGNRRSGGREKTSICAESRCGGKIHERFYQPCRSVSGADPACQDVSSICGYLHDRESVRSSV